MIRTILIFASLASLALLGANASAEDAREITNSIGMKLVRIEPGSFTMGQDGPASDYKTSLHPDKIDDADWDEQPAHRVTITKAFSIGATEVTIGQYRQSDPDFRKDQPDDDAVTAISWEQAVKFCHWLSQKEGRIYRLPTEAEWEYACRAGTASLFEMGDTLPEGFQPWAGDLGTLSRRLKDDELPKIYRRVKAVNIRVAQGKPNAWGLYDMHGNVAEWCSDWYGPYEPGDQIDPAGRIDGDFRVFRGGSHSGFARSLRSANRAAWLPQTRNNKTGFRVVLGEPPNGRALPRPAPPLNARNVRQDDVIFKPLDARIPVFSGPEPYVKIPASSFGPLFSTHNHSPSITECPNGDLLAVWYSCVDEGGSELCNVASRLRLGAKEWEPASPFWDGADVNDHAPKIWWDGDRTLFHFARGRDENLVRTSTDNGATWSTARVIQPVGEFGNQLLRLKDGTLVLGNDSRQCSLVFSQDHGKTWAFNDVAQRPSDFRDGGQGVRYPGIHAPMVQLADGRIMLVSRNDKEEDQAKFDFKTPMSFTADLGKTWTYKTTEFPAISSVQRAAMIRLREGPILFCSFTDQWRDWKKRKGMTFKAADGKEFTGFGMFAAVSFDDGKTWPVRRLITPGGNDRMVNGIDRVEFTMNDTMAEPCGYLAATQTRDGKIQLITSKNHYVFNLAWVKQLPTAP
jgi:formylglycine-generating enzyme required for sulfatase activity